MGQTRAQWGGQTGEGGDQHQAQQVDVTGARLRQGGDTPAGNDETHRPGKGDDQADGRRRTLGLGYLYMGRWVTGVLCCLLVGAIYMTSAVLLIVPTWLLMNLIMAIDMVILSNKHQKKVDAATLMACPECAEMVKREARVCRYCRAELA